MKCDGVFKPFELAPDVCDTCGQGADSHVEKRADMLPYKNAVWEYMISAGGTYEFYGSYGYDTQKLRKHFKECGLDLDRMSTPEMDTIEEFAGSFSPADEVSVIRGVVFCKCGKPPAGDEWAMKLNNGGVSWILRDRNLSQLIWHVVKTGEGK